MGVTDISTQPSDASSRNPVPEGKKGTTDSLHDAITANYLDVTVRGGLSSDGALAFAGQNYFRWIDGWLPTSPSAAALDLGCGTGPMLHLLASRGIKRLVGIDLCKEELDVAPSACFRRAASRGRAHLFEECPRRIV